MDVSWMKVMSAVAIAALGLGAPACDGGDGSDVRVLATALVTAPASGDAATVRLIGATDWEAVGRAQRGMIVRVDGEPVGFVLGDEAIMTFEGSGVSFGVPAGPHEIALADGDEVLWDFGVVETVASAPTDLVYYGSPDDPRVMPLADLGRELAEGQTAARLINLDDRHQPVSALLCPQNVESFDACEVVAEGLGYGDVWTGTLAVADALSLVWERPTPADYPWGRFAGGTSIPVGQPLCQASAPVVNTLTLIPVHANTPEEAPECPYCTSGWTIGDGTTPGDCAW
ncbi:MAG: hypothetical protein EP329_15455 [Deltaproteobacteria bacterium]|nr:MAG: hypothetical protein EP329_15455 [Deltaproteobacteria bacterium]